MNAGNLQRPGWDNPNGVVSIGPAEIKVVEFVVQHEGTWLFHCHVVPHVADDGKYPRGMLTMLTVSGKDSPLASESLMEKFSGDSINRPSQELPIASIPKDRTINYPIGLADRGYGIYNQHCKACHGDFARGEYGPKLQQNPVLHDDQKFWGTVLNGRGNMPAWKERLSSLQIADVQAYLKTLKPPPPP